MCVSLQISDSSTKTYDMYEAAATDQLIGSHAYANRVKDNDVFKKMQIKRANSVSGVGLVRADGWGFRPFGFVRGHIVEVIRYVMSGSLSRALRFVSWSMCV